MNETITKFGHPGTLIAEYRHWVVLLRPAQPTLGALVMAAKSEITAFGALPPEFHAEMSQVTGEIERALAAAVAYQRINYLMLMMVDPHVHFHVLPRYEGTRSAQGLEVPDAGWPKPPELAQAVSLDENQIGNLVGWLKSYWPS